MPALSPSLLPTLLLLPRQDRTTPTATSSAPEIANSSAERFLPSASSTGDAGTHSDQGNGDTRAGLWKYAIVIILAVSALFLTVRLLFIYRLRKARLLAFQEQQNLLHQRRQDRADAERARRAWSGAGGDSRRDSFDSLEEAAWERGMGQSGFDGLAGARMRGHEPPPPGYEETVAPPPTAAPPPPPGPQHRPSLFKRLFSSTSSILPHTASSFSPSTPSSNPPTSFNLQPLSSSSRSADNNNPSSSSFPSSNITRSRASVEAEAVRRALADAGLLVPPSLALRGSRRLSSTATSPPPPSGSSPALSPDDFEAAARRERRERRERRRERRRRRREQEEEGFGLPTYSKERGEGEEVLQRGEGVKSDDEEEGEGSSGEESGSEDERGEGGRRRASTSAGIGGGGGRGDESAGPARGASSPPSSSSPRQA